ncbi:MAG: hypothetical protein J6S13_02205 [Clostridia bacterium]|nr:hypothetical protein [Clostridia bacterium]
MKNFSRAISLILTVVLLLGISLLPVGAAEAACNLTLENKKVIAGQDVTVDVMLDAPVSVISFGVDDIVYDSELMTLTSVEWLVEDATISAWDEEAGKGAIAFAENTEISGAVLRLTFKTTVVKVHNDAMVSVVPVAKVDVDGVDNALDVSVNGGLLNLLAPSKLIGDVDGNLEVNGDDYVYLLYNTLFGDELYPTEKDCDYNEDGVVSDDDAVYLMKHQLFPEDYPLNDGEMSGSVSDKDEDGFGEWIPF